MRTFLTVTAILAVIGVASGLTLANEQASLALANAEGYFQIEQPAPQILSNDSSLPVA
jgi:hypothetical protein